MKIQGKLYYAWLSKPDTRYGSYYHVDVVVSEEEAEKITKDSGITPSKGKLPEGSEGILFKFKTSAQNSDGSLNEPPMVVDSDKNEVDLIIGNGSLGNVIVSPYHNKTYDTTTGILKGVQVLELVEYVPKDPFEVEEGGFTAPKPTVKTGTKVEDAFDE